MNKKTIILIGLGLSLAAISYVTYSAIGQLKDIDYDLFATDEEEDDA
jgi:hypothetical protein